LYPITAKYSSSLNRSLYEGPSDALASKIGVDMDRLKFCTQSPVVLQMTKHNELKTANDDAVLLSNEET
jgi:hypothetical protein